MILLRAGLGPSSLSLSPSVDWAGPSVLLLSLSLSLSLSLPLPRNWSHVLAGEGLNGAINQWAAGLGPWFFPPRYLFCRPENDRQQLLRSPRCRSLIFCLPFRARVLQFCTSDVMEFLSPALRCGHCAFGDCPCRCCCNATASASGGRRPPRRTDRPTVSAAIPPLAASGPPPLGRCPQPWRPGRLPLASAYVDESRLLRGNPTAIHRGVGA